MARPEYLTKLIAMVKDEKTREVIRVCDQFITTVETERMTKSILSLQDRVVELERMLRARGVMV